MPNKIQCNLCGLKIDPRGLGGHKGGKPCRLTQESQGFEPVKHQEQLDGEREFQFGNGTDSDTGDSSGSDMDNNSAEDTTVDQGESESVSGNSGEAGGEPEVLNLGDNSEDKMCGDCDIQLVTASEARTGYRDTYGGIPAEADEQLSNNSHVCPECHKLFSYE